jgi:hypothetical protein
MSSGNQEKNSARVTVFQTLLSSPGMGEKCKIGMQLSRQNILIICRMLENGLEKKDGENDDEILSVLSNESIEELKFILDEMLERGGLIDFYKRLKLI